MKTKILNYFLVFGGLLSLTIGIIGIFLPILPTTPFLLLTAWLFIKSNERLYNKLISHKHLGPYIKNYQENRGMYLKSKIIALVMMWSMISISYFFMLKEQKYHIIILVLGLIGTGVILFYVKTIKKEKPGQNDQA